MQINFGDRPVIYDTREAWLMEFISKANYYFTSKGFPIPINTRVTVGFTSNGMKSRDIGECFFPAASTDGHFEILLNPTTENEAGLAAILTHELCHAANGKGGHRKDFGAIARAVGLEGKLTETYGGQEWFAWAGPIINELGPMPYGAIRHDAIPPRPTKGTYGLKLECPNCGWLARVTRTKHVDPYPFLNCPVPTCDGELVLEA